jgi:hypothetical protein
MKRLLIAATMMLVLTAASTAFANSCTSQSQECKTWARGQGAEAASYSAACGREVSACISRCKAGNKFFLGVSKGPGGGQQYPVTDCK